MARKSDIELDPKRIRLGKGDFETMGALFPTIGASVAIRLLVRNYIQKVQAATTPIEISLPTNLEEILDD